MYVYVHLRCRCIERRTRMDCGNKKPEDKVKNGLSSNANYIQTMMHIFCLRFSFNFYLLFIYFYWDLMSLVNVLYFLVFFLLRFSNELCEIKKYKGDHLRAKCTKKRSLWKKPYSAVLWSKIVKNQIMKSYKDDDVTVKQP